MDKSVGGTEDAVKQLDYPENGGQQLQNDSVDGKELPHSTAGEVSKPTEVGAEEEEKDKSDVTTKSKKEDLNIMETEAEDTNNVINEGVKEAEDPDNLRSEGVKEAEHVNNVKGRAKEGDNENNETSEVKSEVEDQCNIKSKAEDPSKIGSEANGPNACESGEQHGNSVENIVEHQKHIDNVVLDKNHQGRHSVELTANEGPQNEPGVPDEVHRSKDEAMSDLHETDNEEKADELKESDEKAASETAMAGGDAEMPEMKETTTEVNNTDQNVKEETVNVVKGPENKIVSANAVADGKTEIRETPITKCELDDRSVVNYHDPATPTPLVKCATANGGNHSGEAYRNFINEPKIPGDEDGTTEEQAAFMRELESFYRERAMEFKPPRFYGQQLNCLKLWRAVIRLGGYDRVTGSKLWRQVGESFHPPKTCTTVSWTFRIFYEKALLEYERYKTESGELSLPLATADASGVDFEGNGYQASGSGRARRDAASRAMQGWHAQRLFGSGEVGEPGMKDKNFNNMPKREKNLKSIGALKQKRPNEVEHPVKAARTELSKQLVASVVDVGTPADWVKINVRETKDCFEVYALVPGLLRDEVRVQSDPAGRLVITGQPEHSDNPWGVTAFKKVVSLPGRIDPLQTSAVVTLHGRLSVRVPFEQSNI